MPKAKFIFFLLLSLLCFGVREAAFCKEAVLTGVDGHDSQILARPAVCAGHDYEFRYLPPSFSRSVVTQESLRETVTFLCEGIPQGRGGGEGADYIAEFFASAGLQPWKGEWLHRFEGGCNVAGYLPGNTGRCIVVGAYYDCLGRIAEVLYPGADADASGIAALLGIAKLLSGSSDTEGLRDEVIFIAFDLHYKDYAGARAFLKELSGQRPALMLSLDTIGTTLAPVNPRRPLSLIALSTVKRYNPLMERSAEVAGVDLHFDYYGSERFTRLFLYRMGEQSVFIESGIPSMLLTSGVTLNVNKPLDTPETLDYYALRSRVLCLARFLALVRDR